MTDFRGWVPIRVYRGPTGPWVDWCFPGDLRFTHPFFDETVQVALRRPFNNAFRRQTSLAFLDDLAAAEPGLPPTGFIFHVSRCGSTLLTQMLAALPSHVVLSEPTAIDGLLTLGGPGQGVGPLRGLMSALGRQRFPDERRFFVKFDSWHVTDLPLIRRAFPDVPWVFLYRDPAEVIVSHLTQPGAAMVPSMRDPAWLGLMWDEAVTTSREEYAARAVATCCRAALANRDAKALFVNYDRMPGAVFDDILPHFGVHVSADDKARMAEAAGRNAKSPTESFAPDREEKRALATEAVRRAADRWVGPLLADLARAAG